MFWHENRALWRETKEPVSASKSDPTLIRGRSVCLFRAEIVVALQFVPFVNLRCFFVHREACKLVAICTRVHFVLAHSHILLVRFR